MNVIIADDVPANCRLLEAYLHKWGYTTDSFYNGNDVFDFLSSHNEPAIVILDWMMPDKSGIEICTQLRLDNSDVPFYIILLTAKNRIEDLEMAFEGGADDYIYKPFDGKELKSRLVAGERIINLQTDLRNREIDTRLEVFRLMTEMAELKDRTTGEHVLRVGELSSKIAKEMALSPQYCKDIEIFARFHDIGKIGIPDSLLLAERKLTDEEFEMMKTHTIMGYNILKESPFMKMASDIVYAHHERFDGKGYPRGLAGENIPLSARIVSVADVYDALRSVRPYKKAMPHKDACDIIVDGAGSFFDPAVVIAFERLGNSLAILTEEHFNT